MPNVRNHTSNMIATAKNTLAEPKKKINSILQRFKPISQRFWEKVNKNGKQMSHVPELGNCWEWTAGKRGGSKIGVSYGQFKVNKKPDMAHVFSFRLHGGIIPEKHIVCHKCDNTICIRPSHLFAGTHKDNRADCINKNRANSACGENHGSFKHPESVSRGDNHYRRLRPETIIRGERVPWAKLNNEKVIQIRARLEAGDRNADVAKLYNISKSQCHRIGKRQRWTHI